MFRYGLSMTKRRKRVSLLFEVLQYGTKHNKVQPHSHVLVYRRFLSHCILGERVLYPEREGTWTSLNCVLNDFSLVLYCFENCDATIVFVLLWLTSNFQPLSWKCKYISALSTQNSCAFRQVTSNQHGHPQLQQSSSTLLLNGLSSIHSCLL